MVGTDNISHIRRELQAVAILVTKMLLRTTRIRRVLGAGGGGTGPDVTRMSIEKKRWDATFERIHYHPFFVLQ
jgi:hypothetical protein